MIVKPFPFFSYALSQRKVCYVLLPDDYEKETEKRYPTVYVLHGMYGSETDWLHLGGAKETIETMRQEGSLRDAIFVFPSDGGLGDGTFYLDWYDGSGRFEQYFLYDLVSGVDRSFRTIRDKWSRALVGLSMGGYGAFMLSLRHPDLFGIGASLSGAFGDLEGYMQPHAAARLLGPKGGPYAKQYDVMELSASRIDDPQRPYLYMDCGRDDTLVYPHNVRLHEHLSSIGYTHVYQEFAGGHTWEYWKEHLPDALRFVENCFRHAQH